MTKFSGASIWTDGNNIYYSDGNVTNVGDDYEDDSEFRLRWIATNSVSASSKTEGGLRRALLDLVNSSSDLKIRQNRTNSTVDGLSAHSMNIILKSGYSDEVIAQKILDHYTDGVGLEGIGDTDLDVTVTLQDSENNDVDIIFTRAEAVPIKFNIEISLKNGSSLDTDKVKSAIVDNFNYVLGEKIVANDFYQYLNTLDFIDYVDTLEVSEDTIFGNVVNLDFYQYGTISASDITVETV